MEPTVTDQQQRLIVDRTTVTTATTASIDNNAVTITDTANDQRHKWLGRLMRIEKQPNQYQQNNQQIATVCFHDREEKPHRFHVTYEDGTQKWVKINSKQKKVQIRNDALSEYQVKTRYGNCLGNQSERGNERAFEWVRTKNAEGDDYEDEDGFDDDDDDDEEEEEEEDNDNDNEYFDDDHLMTQQQRHGEYQRQFQTRISTMQKRKRKQSSSLQRNNTQMNNNNNNNNNNGGRQRVGGAMAQMFNNNNNMNSGYNNIQQPSYNLQQIQQYQQQIQHLQMQLQMQNANGGINAETTTAMQQKKKKKKYVKKGSFMGGDAAIYGEDLALNMNNLLPSMLPMKHQQHAHGNNNDSQRFSMLQQHQMQQRQQQQQQQVFLQQQQQKQKKKQQKQQQQKEQEQEQDQDQDQNPYNKKYVTSTSRMQKNRAFTTSTMLEPVRPLSAFLFEQHELAKCTVCGKICKSHPGFVAHVKKHADEHPEKVRLMLAASKNYRHNSSSARPGVNALDNGAQIAPREVTNDFGMSAYEPYVSDEEIITVAKGRKKRHGAGKMRIDDDFDTFDNISPVKKKKKKNPLVATTCDKCGRVCASIVGHASHYRVCKGTQEFNSFF